MKRIQYHRTSTIRINQLVQFYFPQILSPALTENRHEIRYSEVIKRTWNRTKYKTGIFLLIPAIWALIEYRQGQWQFHWWWWSYNWWLMAMA